MDRRAWWVTVHGVGMNQTMTEATVRAHHTHGIYRPGGELPNFLCVLFPFAYCRMRLKTIQRIPFFQSLVKALVPFCV